MKIELLKPHEHAATACHPGDVIDLADDLGQWLCSIGAARKIPTATADPTVLAKPTKQPNTTQE